jgi:hypothetical protein
VNDPHYHRLLESLTETISDYRQGEILPITPTHVEKWLKQFDLPDQPIILSEMASIMQRFYFSRTRVKECIRSFIKDHLIGSAAPTEVLPHISFLRLQANRSSQEAMLELVDEILDEEYSISLAMAGTEQISRYIYVDDAIYTGNTLRYDMIDGEGSTGWISNFEGRKCRLLVYTLVDHTEGIDYVRRLISGPAERKEITLQRYTSMEINNSHLPGNSIEVLWPEKIDGDTIVDSYVSHLYQQLQYGRGPEHLFRYAIEPYEETLFSSLEARRTVERAFLKKGAHIIRACKNPAHSMRPLGFMPLPSLGFGTLFVTYRNIANNCPLVFWWGEPGFPSSHPFSLWYPLFPRRTNARRDTMESEQTFDEHPF